jgi:hypothetical protein
MGLRPSGTDSLTPTEAAKDNLRLGHEAGAPPRSQLAAVARRAQAQPQARSPMSLSGNLRTMALSEILQWVAIGKKTGTLYLERESVQKRIIFRTGRMTSSWSNDPRESLGQFLVRERLITEEQLFKALLRQEEEGRLIGSILVSDGVLSEDQLQRCLIVKAEETVYDLFMWSDGAFDFREGDYPENVQFAIDGDVTTVLMEGVHRVDELQRIRKVIPSMRTTFRLNTPAPDVRDAAERQALGLCAAGKSLAELCLEMRRSEFEGAQLVFSLLQRGAIAIESPGEDLSPADSVGRIKALLAESQQHVAAHRFENALACYEQVLAIDRINQDAKKGLLAVFQARNRHRAAQSVPLDKIPVLTKDLAALTQEKLDPQEGFLLSRVNGDWDVQSILKLCPMGEEDTLLILARLLKRKLIELR